MKNYRALTKGEWKTFIKPKRLIIASIAGVAAYYILHLFAFELGLYIDIAIATAVSNLLTEVID